MRSCINSQSSDADADDEKDGGDDDEDSDVQMEEAAVEAYDDPFCDSDSDDESCFTLYDRSRTLCLIWDKHPRAFCSPPRGRDKVDSAFNRLIFNFAKSKAAHFARRRT